MKSKMMEMSGVIPVKANKGIFPSWAVQAMLKSKSGKARQTDCRAEI